MADLKGKSKQFRRLHGLACYMFDGTDRGTRRALNQLRTMVWFESLLLHAASRHIYSAYALGRAIRPESYRAGEDRLHSNQWAKYQQGLTVPRPAVLQRAEHVFQGSLAAFQHPFFDAIDPLVGLGDRGDRLMRQLHPSTQRAVFENSYLARGVYRRRASRARLLNLLEVQGTLDAVTAIIITVREAHESGACTQESMNRLCEALFHALLVCCTSCPTMTLLREIALAIEHWVFRRLAVGEWRCQLDLTAFSNGVLKLWSHLLSDEDNDRLKLTRGAWQRRAALYFRGRLGDDFRFALQPHRVLVNERHASLEARETVALSEKLRQWGWDALSSGGAARCTEWTRFQAEAKEQCLSCSHSEH